MIPTSVTVAIVVDHLMVAMVMSMIVVVMDRNVDMMLFVVMTMVMPVDMVPGD